MWRLPCPAPRTPAQPSHISAAQPCDAVLQVRRWQDIRKKDSVNSDPFNPNLKVRFCVCVAGWLRAATV